MLNPLLHPICLEQPRRVAATAWAAHLPFAMYLVDVGRPGVIVELGTGTGVSYCAFCQAVKQLGLPANCYAIGTWHRGASGLVNQTQLEDLKRHHDPLYSDFSTVIQSTFDEALPKFADASIDLLHIDGHHDYELLKHLFESWLPKMSTRGIVLLHDINDRRVDLGIGRLWEEIKQRHRTFEFEHERGLGVVATGDAQEAELQNLFALSGPEAALTRRFFHQLDERLAHQNASSNAEATLTLLVRERDQLLTHARALDKEIEVRNQTIDAISDQLDTVQNRAATILNSRSWQWVNRYGHLKTRLLRPARRALRRSSNGFGVVNGRRDYDAWIKQHDALSNRDRLNIIQRIAGLQHQPQISVIVVPSSGDSAGFEQTVKSLRAQLYANYDVSLIPADTLNEVASREDLADDRFQILKPNAGDDSLAAANRALENLTGEFVTFVHAGDELAPHALYLLVECLNRFSGLEIVYTDEDCIAGDGARCQPYFKPDWNEDLLHSGDFLSRLAIYRTATVRRIGGLRSEFGESAFYDLALRATEGLNGFRIRHVPHVLYHRREPAARASSVRDNEARALQEHFDRLAIPASVTKANGFSRVLYPLAQPQPLVSVIIATRDRVDLLQPIVGDVLAKTDYEPLELIVVNNQSTDPATLEFLKQIRTNPRVSVLSYDRPFNFSAINNYAAGQAKGEVLAFLNNDLRIISGDWLREMVSHAIRPNIGAVGAKLYYPDGSIQHAGIIVGLGNLAGYVHRYAPRDALGHGGRLKRTQDFSAVTAACLVMKRAVFEQLGGFDEVNLPVAYNDVDLCLRLRERGYRVLWTPYAELYHLESASRPSDYSREQRSRYEAECAYLQARWGNYLARDPFYNPNLTIESEDFALAWPPRIRKPWLA